MNTAVLYARFSPGARLNCKSAEAQLEQGRKYCKFHDCEIIGEFADEFISGKSIDNRPAFRKAMDLVCKEKSILVVYSLSRFARSTKDAIVQAERIEKAKANLVSLSQKIDTTSPTGRFLFRILAAVNELEREQISQRTSDAMKSYQRSGRRMSNRVPYGFMVDPDNTSMMIPCPKEQKVITRIKELSVAGYSLRGISKQLWLEKLIGRRYPRSKVLAITTGIINPATIRMILQRENNNEM